ncbi:hypothetical protein AXF42_Ash000136 [Apostasia shenzhenica]|uniref:Uncharacterized protein n=1 Tax=Apostasia shenzhenica TaxID=1088818 RepID=A0A2I0AFI8_9ASPA|nr:hypothetical protein AXF42_Ash000136 [Apostasia shenzhenica]
MRIAGVDGTGSSPREGAGARAERASTVLLCERREGAQAASVARAASWGRERHTGEQKGSRAERHRASGQQGDQRRGASGGNCVRRRERPAGRPKARRERWELRPAARAAPNGTGQAERAKERAEQAPMEADGARGGQRRELQAGGGWSCEQGGARAEQAAADGASAGSSSWPAADWASATASASSRPTAEWESPTCGDGASRASAAWEALAARAPRERSGMERAA